MSAAQQAYLFYCANQDPEKPGATLDYVDFLPFPGATTEIRNRVRDKISDKTKRELSKISKAGIFNPRVELKLYDILFNS